MHGVLIVGDSYNLILGELEVATLHALDLVGLSDVPDCEPIIAERVGDRVARQVHVLCNSSKSSG